MQNRLSPRINDILLAKNGTTGVAAIVDRDVDFDIYVSLALLRPSDKIIPRLLLHFINSPIAKKQFNNRLKGVGVPNLHLKEIREVIIPYPKSLPEQKRIVAILEEAFAEIDQAISNTEKNIQNASDLFESYLNNIFTRNGGEWIEDKLINLTSKIGSGATPKGGAASYKNQGISLIRSLNVHDRWFKVEKLAFIDDTQADKLSNVVVEPGDVLFNITGASVARCCVVPDDHLPARVNQHVSILRPNTENFSSEFLCYLLTSRPYKERLLNIGEEGGSTRQAITKSQLQQLVVSFPEGAERQKKVVRYLDDLEIQTKQLETIYKQKLDDLKELKKSLLQKAFLGELTSDLRGVA